MKKTNTAIEGLRNIEKNKRMQEENISEDTKVLRETMLQMQRELRDEKEKPSLVIYVLLALFLGGIGMHDFYAGKTASGVIKLLFCWTGIPAIIAVFNIIGALLNRKNFR